MSPQNFNSALKFSPKCGFQIVDIRMKTFRKPKIYRKANALAIPLPRCHCYIQKIQKVCYYYYYHYHYLQEPDNSSAVCPEHITSVAASTVLLFGSSTK